MRREGHFLQNIWFKGKWGDEYLYAILKEEWLLKKKLQPRLKRVFNSIEKAMMVC